MKTEGHVKVSQGYSYDSSSEYAPMIGQLFSLILIPICNWPKPWRYDWSMHLIGNYKGSSGGQKHSKYRLSFIKTFNGHEMTKKERYSVETENAKKTNSGFE